MNKVKLVWFHSNKSNKSVSPYLENNVLADTRMKQKYCTETQLFQTGTDRSIDSMQVCWFWHFFPFVFFQSRQNKHSAYTLWTQDLCWRRHNYKSGNKTHGKHEVCVLGGRARRHADARGIRTAMWSVCERGGVARSTRLCADSGNRVETAAAAAAWQWRRKEWSNAKKIPPERV